MAKDKLVTFKFKMAMSVVEQLDEIGDKLDLDASEIMSRALGKYKTLVEWRLKNPRGAIHLVKETGHKSLFLMEEFQ